MKIDKKIRGEGEILAFVIIAGLIGGLILFWMVVHPFYKVWSYGKDGEAALQEAMSSRKIAIQEAEAKRDSAKLLAEAEVERAKGVAQANQIIGDSLKGNEVYLHYLWIHSLESGKNEIIYVPTEANLPILEANRFAKEKQK